MPKWEDAPRNAPDTGVFSAPDVGAFFFEDAIAELTASGCVIGRVDFTAPPGRAGADADALTVFYSGKEGDPRRAPAPGMIPPAQFRVLRCVVGDYDDSGAPVCDLLISRAPDRTAPDVGL